MIHIAKLLSVSTEESLPSYIRPYLSVEPLKPAISSLNYPCFLFSIGFLKCKNRSGILNHFLVIAFNYHFKLTLIISSVTLTFMFIKCFPIPRTKICIFTNSPLFSHRFSSASMKRHTVCA